MMCESWVLKCVQHSTLCTRNPISLWMLITHIIHVYWGNRSQNCSQIIKTYCCCSCVVPWRMHTTHTHNTHMHGSCDCSNLFAWKCCRWARCDAHIESLCSYYCDAHAGIDDSAHSLISMLIGETQSLSHTHKHTPNARALLLSARAFPLILWFSFYFKSEFTEKIFSRIPHIGIFIQILRALARMLDSQSLYGYTCPHAWIRYDRYEKLKLTMDNNH